MYKDKLLQFFNCWELWIAKSFLNKRQIVNLIFFINYFHLVQNLNKTRQSQLRFCCKVLGQYSLVTFILRFITLLTSRNYPDDANKKTNISMIDIPIDCLIYSGSC